MATFTVWKFDNPDGADAAAEILAGAELDALLTVIDRAVVSWPVGAKHPRTRRHDDVRRSTSWGAFWGLLLGSVFLMPVLGAAAGAGVGALATGLSRVGITKEQIDVLRWQITEGTSAPFVLTENADLDQLAERFAGMPRLLIDTNLTDVESGHLLEAFGTE